MKVFLKTMRLESKRSFTLLESIVAIYVLLLGIVGTMTLAERNIASVLTLRDQLIAANLAQEGIELVRNKRDSNFLLRSQTCSILFPPPLGPCNPNDANMDGITTNVMGGPAPQCNGVNCGITDPVIAGSIQLLPCTHATMNGCDVYLGTDGVYDHSSGMSVKTKFNRRIFVTPSSFLRLNMSSIGGTNNDIRDWNVEVRVAWQDRFGAKVVLLKTVLTPTFEVD